MPDYQLMRDNFGFGINLWPLAALTAALLTGSTLACFAGDAGNRSGTERERLFIIGQDLGSGHGENVNRRKPPVR